ncbi:hypothetical protein PHLCEN_2v2920 [Hermanssonia centrifuga]|uniref:Uncharacterized protein n=1 Tax=Hermanssonia centrifuga TaxID=98765 RepID=A0A2R6RIC0_9APHY|nr:hypothetical protein PHLCEN_2v2920 [Hermanssonia centrifuga]
MKRLNIGQLMHLVKEYRDARRLEGRIGTPLAVLALEQNNSALLSRCAYYFMPGRKGSERDSDNLNVCK